MENIIDVNVLTGYSTKHSKIKSLRKKFIPRFLIFLFGDILLILVAFFIAHAFVTPKTTSLFTFYKHPYIIFSAIWICSSILSQKYVITKPFKRWFVRVYFINLITLIAIIILFSLIGCGFSLYRITCLVFLTFLIESTFFYLYLLHRRITNDASKIELFYKTFMTSSHKYKILNDPFEIIDKRLKKIIIDGVGVNGFKFIDAHLAGHYSKSKFTSSISRSDLTIIQPNKFVNIVNLKDINQFKKISQYFDLINAKIPIGGKFIGFFETYKGRKKRIFKKYPIGLKKLFYSLDILWHRICPKLELTRPFYNLISGGYNRSFSKTEIFGRLYCAGYEILSEKKLNGLLFFSARKISDPILASTPSYGPLVKLKRIGKNGKNISVYKLRTMFAFSEFLQEYVYTQNKLAEGGKLKDDFRVTVLGKILRKCWLDELPMFFNVLKGQIKIVGVRPLSNHYFNLYTDELKEKRIKTKPGLVPPFYYDLPKTLEEIISSELKYLAAYEKHPFRTDLVYFWGAMYNIFIKKARSS